MKNFLNGIIALCWIYFLSTTAQSQDCRVLVEELNKNYKGACKNELANGSGEASGELFSYKGEFKKGYPDGEGTLKMNDSTVFKGEWKKGMIWGYGELIDKNGNVKKGYWKGNITSFIYVGTDKGYLNGYKILDSEKMENATVNFVKSTEALDKLNINIFENHVRQITNFEIMEMTSGIIYQVVNNSGRLKAELIHVTYPITMRIRYILPYGTQDTQLPAGVDNLNSPRIIRFTIVEPGLWDVSITHR
jgi:hypothetical protein